MSEHRFDPAVVALLDELARSSSSGLLRVPKERLLRWVGREEDVLTPHHPFLSRGEKHLIEAYREQAASLLRDACVIRLVERADSGVFVESGRTPSGEWIRERAHRVLHAVETGLLDRRTQMSLEGFEGREASQLAAAALRLMPSDAARIALGAALHSEGHTRAAMRTFEAVLRGRPTPIFRSVALDNLASIRCTMLDYPRALALHIEANRAANGRWKTATSRMVVAIQLGEAGEAKSAAHLLNQMEPNPAWCDELARFLRRTREAKRWSPTSQATRVVPVLRDQVAGDARKICDALLEV
jgi:hypothetical protein